MVGPTDSYKITLPDGTPRFGAAYYPEYFPPEQMPADLNLMQRAGVSVIRVGESVWSTWEPRDGEFDLEWLRPTLDAAHERGIGVVLGTPTYAIPPWLQYKYPEIAAEHGTGLRVNWGARQESDITHPAFRTHAERVIRAVVGHYAAHPAVIGFQVDNEPGARLLHNDGVFSRFVDELRTEYGTVAALNEAWGLVYWSHRLTDFAELWRPDGNSLPQYDLAWRRFQAKLTTEFLAWQRRIVAEYARDDQFVTTCVAYARPAVDDVAVGGVLDVASANIYYDTQDHLDLDIQLPRIVSWTSTGVHGLVGAADRAYATAQQPFLITETNAQSIGDSDQNYPPYPGQLRQAALAMIACGAGMIEYWHWNTIPYGAETFWGGVLPHSGEPGRIYREVAALGQELAAIGPSLARYRPDADITLVYSQASRWAMNFTPPLPPDEPRESAYEAIFTAFHRGVVESGRQARIVHDRQLGEDVAQLVADHPVLVVPGLQVSDDQLLARLRHYARSGGHLVLGIRSAIADPMARVRTVRQPAGFTEAAGVWYEESSNLDQPVALSDGGNLSLSDAARATRWADGLIVTDAEVLARYQPAVHDRFAAITTKLFGDGRITVVGTVPNPRLSRDLTEWLCPSPVAGGWGVEETPVTVLSGRNADDEQMIFLHNWSSRPEEISTPAQVADPISGQTFPVGTVITVQGRDARVLARSRMC